jgi:hypothetical protein
MSSSAYLLPILLLAVVSCAPSRPELPTAARSRSVAAAPSGPLDDYLGDYALGPGPASLGEYKSVLAAGTLDLDYLVD